MSETLIKAFQLQAGTCGPLGSPFQGAFCGEIAEALAAGDTLEGMLDPWADTSVRQMFLDAVQLRLLAAFHDLVLSGDAPELAATYPRPDRPGDAGAAWTVARALLPAQRARIEAFIGHEPQTNEVRRSACLLGGFLTVAGETGLPLSVFEMGASAGLNAGWDRFRYVLGEAVWGDPAAAVVIDTDWRGPPPPLDAPLEVVARAACDRRPVDLTDPVERRRLLAYIWPDQFERLARAQAAIEAALAAGVRVETADAPAWAAARAAPRTGVATVLYHSVFWPYLPPESQAALTATAASFGAQATVEAPFAWLRMESPPGDLARMEVRLTLYPGGEDRLLAVVHPHGAWVEWQG